MKKLRNFSLTLLILLLTLAGTWKTGSAQSGNCNSEMVSTTCTIEAGEIFNGDLSLVDSTLIIEEGSRINGSVSAMRSHIELKGWLTGDLTTFLGSVEVADTAHINGDLVTVGGNIEVSENAIVNGEKTLISMNDLTNLDTWSSVTTGQKPSGSILGRFIWLVFVSLALAAIGLVAVLIFQKPADRMSTTIQTRPLIAFAIGLLFVISLPFAIVLMSVTIILIPVVIAVVLVLPIVIVFSWVALGLTLSQWIASRLKWDWAPAVHAAVGTLLITFIAGLLLFIQCVGWVFVSLLLLTGLGAFVLLFFKTSHSIPAKAASPIPLANPDSEPVAQETTAVPGTQPEKPTEETQVEKQSDEVDLFPEPPGEENQNSDPDLETKEEK